MLRRVAPCIALVFGALCACLTTQAMAAPGGNLLANPGFETTLSQHPWMPTAWDTSAAPMPTSPV